MAPGSDQDDQPGAGLDRLAVLAEACAFAERADRCSEIRRRWRGRAAPASCRKCFPRWCAGVLDHRSRSADAYDLSSFTISPGTLVRRCRHRGSPSCFARWWPMDWASETLSQQLPPGEPLTSRRQAPTRFALTRLYCATATAPAVDAPGWCGPSSCSTIAISPIIPHGVQGTGFTSRRPGTTRWFAAQRDLVAQAPMIVRSRRPGGCAPSLRAGSRWESGSRASSPRR